MKKFSSLNKIKMMWNDGKIDRMVTRLNGGYHNFYTETNACSLVCLTDLANRGSLFIVTVTWTEIWRNHITKYGVIKLKHVSDVFTWYEQTDLATVQVKSGRKINGIIKALELLFFCLSYQRVAYDGYAHCQLYSNPMTFLFKFYNTLGPLSISSNRPLSKAK